MNEMQNEMFGPIATKVKAELATYVNEMGFHLLIDVSAENGNVVWANAGNNITKEVMVRVNDAYKKAGGAASRCCCTARACEPRDKKIETGQMS